jgi:hypothetical protein
LSRGTPRQEPNQAAATRPPGEFAAIGYVEPWSDLDAVQVVRVEMPREALAGLGWPVAEEGRQTVQADLLVGQDGIARGIRLARPEKGEGEEEER